MEYRKELIQPNGITAEGIDEIMKHFGVSSEEADRAEAFICKNDDFFREKTGVVLNLRCCEAAKGKKKARIIVDYDADFPKILTRVIFP